MSVVQAGTGCRMRGRGGEGLKLGNVVELVQASGHKPRAREVTMEIALGSAVKLCKRSGEVRWKALSTLIDVRAKQERGGRNGSVQSLGA